mmetsp:Transcript_12409/g.19407  ORF Transcript_12409/g.19407 Transcript_12409/m.19407 type:complete len:160 (+) Transcript_12409:2463-2942(+)
MERAQDHSIQQIYSPSFNNGRHLNDDIQKAPHVEDEAPLIMKGRLNEVESDGSNKAKPVELNLNPRNTQSSLMMGNIPSAAPSSRRSRDFEQEHEKASVSISSRQPVSAYRDQSTRVLMDSASASNPHQDQNFDQISNYKQKAIQKKLLADEGKDDEVV